MKSIKLFLIYFGTFPNYFDIWLKAVDNNKTIDFCIITDCKPQGYDFPPNVRLLIINVDDFKKKIEEKIKIKISLKNYGRISQFRPALAYVFPEEVQGYDFWGYIECDLIPGNIRHFITDEILDRYEKIFKLGHFQIFKNNEKMNTLFMQCDKSALDYKFAYKNNVLFFEELIGMHNIANALNIKTYEENIFADTKCYEYMFTKSSYGYNDVSLEKQCLFEYKDRSLYEIQIENNNIVKKEIIYVHLQKREMKIETSDNSEYIIVPNSFLPYKTFDSDFFQNILNQSQKKEQKYREMMDKKLSTMQKNRNKELCWWILRGKRFFIRRHGGVDLNGERK